MKTHLKRFAVLGAATLAFAAVSRAPEVTLTSSRTRCTRPSPAASPRYHRRDIAGEWAKKKGVKSTGSPAHRADPRSSFPRAVAARDLDRPGFVINKFETPKISTLLEPLDDGRRSADRDFAGIPANLLVATRYKAC